MAIFTWRAEVNGSSCSGEFAMSSSEFGDGYSQDIPKGINNEKQKWTVVVTGYGKDVDAVLAFIREQKGQPFQWKAPRNGNALTWWKCKRYSHSDQGGDYWTLSMEFEQAYAP